MGRFVTSCQRYIIKGRVQGVWFRAHTQKKAQELGLTGWVKNLPDGQVEVLACGDANQLKDLEGWLWQGPLLAKVVAVEASNAEWEQHEKFSVI